MIYTLSPQDLAVLCLMILLFGFSLYEDGVLNDVAKILLLCGTFVGGFLYVWYRLSSFSDTWQRLHP